MKRHWKPAWALAPAMAVALAALVTLGPASEALAVADTLTVIQRPLLNIPSLVRVGDTLAIDCEASPATGGWTAELVRNQIHLPMQVASSAYDPSTLWWRIMAVVPQVPVHDVYDLVVTAGGGIVDTTRHSVAVIPGFKDDYYFIQVTDTHLPTHRFYYENGADTDSSEMVDFREIIRDVNIINPEFVLLTGDLVNEGELEDYLGRHYFSRAQAILGEFQVPVFLTSGNHDIGGWDATPPPAGTARRDWWKFFGWKRLDNPPPGAPWYTQDYSFDYGPVHYVGLEAYDNYDRWRYSIYGSDSFTAGQMQWLVNDMAASGKSRFVLFYHYDFSNQINLTALGADMALSGHVHRDEGSIYSYPYSLRTNNACDGERSYRLIRVSNGVVQPSPTVSAGGSGGNLAVDFSPANDGTNFTVTAAITNNLSERFEHSRLRFLLPGIPGRCDVTGGTLVQVDDSGPLTVCYVGVDILPSSSKTVTVTLDITDIEPPTVTLIAPNGGEVWEDGSTYDITWVATDNIAVNSLTLVLSADGGVSYPDTLATGLVNSGAYQWTVAADATTTARIKVVAYDTQANYSQDMSNADFEIRPASAGIPAHLVMEGTSPNPFSGHASIRFGLPQEGTVEIDLFDVSGRFVMNLVRDHYSEGYHAVDWDNDGAVGSGLYFIRLRLGSDTATRKVVIPR
jgi:hypothetical protein